MWLVVAFALGCPDTIVPQECALNASCGYGQAYYWGYGIRSCQPCDFLERAIIEGACAVSSPPPPCPTALALYNQTVCEEMCGCVWNAGKVNQLGELGFCDPGGVCTYTPTAAPIPPALTEWGTHNNADSRSHCNMRSRSARHLES